MLRKPLIHKSNTNLLTYSHGLMTSSESSDSMIYVYIYTDVYLDIYDHMIYIYIYILCMYIYIYIGTSLPL